ncbi:hypothetical protein GAPWKB11_1786 [Gilliamella apicola]|jgi:hypothetical protein|nr:hypothetical protein [Gilliamella apicola]KFA58289.1 hypothetical protein GAPWKB11_1786 [Gilliamella apicola]
MLKKISILWIAFGLIFSSLAFSEEGSSIIHGPFNISWCINGELVFTRKNDGSVDFILKYIDDSKLEKFQVIDNYEIEGSEPQVESLFFNTVLNTRTVFVIISWEINSHGAGTYGKLYQVYAYNKSPNKNNQFIKNMTLYHDRKLTGIEGVIDSNISSFKYKTAAEVKKYINKTYNKK